jgi:hypothetical protein
VRKTLTWVAGLIGLAAFVRRRSRPAATVQGNGEAYAEVAPGLPADPAADLRRKLEQTREAAPSTAPDPEAGNTLDERRARVHEQAQAAITLMRSPDPDSVPGRDEGHGLDG